MSRQAPKQTSTRADAAGCGEGPVMMPADKRDEALKRLARATA